MIIPESHNGWCSRHACPVESCLWFVAVDEMCRERWYVASRRRTNRTHIIHTKAIRCVFCSYETDTCYFYQWKQLPNAQLTGYNNIRRMGTSQQPK